MVPQTVLNSVGDGYTSSGLCLSPSQRPWTTRWIVAAPSPPFEAESLWEKGSVGKGRAGNAFCISK